MTRRSQMGVLNNTRHFLLARRMLGILAALDMAARCLCVWIQEPVEPSHYSASSPIMPRPTVDVYTSFRLFGPSLEILLDPRGATGYRAGTAAAVSAVPFALGIFSGLGMALTKDFDVGRSMNVLCWLGLDAVHSANPLMMRILDRRSCAWLWSPRYPLATRAYLSRGTPRQCTSWQVFRS